MQAASSPTTLYDGKSNYILPVQYLRGIATIIVVLTHVTSMQHTAFPESPRFLPVVDGTGAVDVFFVISGFIIAHITRTTPSGSTEAWEFFCKRAIRIIPAYWFFTLLVFFTSKYDTLSGGQASSVNIMMLLKSMLFIKPGFPLLFVGWTLTLEMFFYLIFSLLMIRFFHLQRLIWCGSILIAIAALPLFFESENRYFRFYTQAVILEFIGGMLIAHFYPVLQSMRSRKREGALLVIGLAATISATLILDPKTLIKYRSLVCGVPAILIMLGILHVPHGRIWEPVNKLGAISYSLYLCHAPCVYFAAAAVQQWDNPPINPNIIYCVLAVVASLVMAGFSFNILEKWSDKTLRKWIIRSR